MILSCRKASWFSFPRSFPAGKRRGFPFHDPFLQESVVVFLSTILSCRKASWFSFPRSFPAGKRRGFPFHDPFLQESVVVSLSLRERSSALCSSDWEHGFVVSSERSQEIISEFESDARR